MKKLIFALFITFGTFSIQAQEIKWMSLDVALTLQKKNPKPIFMDVYTDWCGPCKMLDKQTFQDKSVVEYISKNYYGVKFNAEDNSVVNYKGKKYVNPGFSAERKGRNSAHEFGLFLKIQGYPSMVILDKKGEISNTIVGFRTAEQLLPELKN